MGIDVGKRGMDNCSTILNIMNTLPFSLPGLSSFLIIYALVLLSTRVLLASGVARAAGALQSDGRGTYFVSPAVWALIALVGGVAAVGIYWLVNHSSLRPLRENGPIQ